MAPTPASESSGVRSAEVVRFERVNDTLDKLRKLQERWNNRLQLKITPLRERYIEGRLSILCYFAGPSKPSDVHPATGIYNNCDIAEKIVVAINRAEAGELGNGDSWDEQLVLVNVVELAESPKRIVPSFVRTYLVKNHRAEIGSGLHYFSELTGLLQSVPRFVFRKVDAVGVQPSPFGNVARDMVERGMQVVNGVADDQRHGLWSRGRFVSDDVLAGLRVDVYPHSVEVSFEEGGDNGLKLVDVAYGPLDL